MTAHPLAKSVIIVALLVTTGPAHADGITFSEDGAPRSPHTWIATTAKQQKAIADTPVTRNGPWTFKRLRFELTAEQRKALASQVGEAPRFVFAASRGMFEGSCTCGDYNTALIGEGRIAVLHHYIVEDAIDQTIVERLERRRTDAKLLARRELSPSLTGLVDVADGSAAFLPGQMENTLSPLRIDAGGLWAPLGRAIDDMPLKGFNWALELPSGWTARRVKMAAVPRVEPRSGPGGALLDVTVRDFCVTGTSQARVISWPDAGAVHDVDGTRRLLVPGVLVNASSQVALYPAWIVYVFDDRGLVASASVVSPEHRSVFVARWRTSGDRAFATSVVRATLPPPYSDLQRIDYRIWKAPTAP